MTSLVAALRDQARELLPRAVSLRREIHAHPELGLDPPQPGEEGYAGARHMLDEDAMAVGIARHAAAALRYLGGPTA